MTTARIRSLTRKPRRLEAIAKGALPAVKKEMELHLAIAKEVLSVPHHKFPSTYTITHNYEKAWRTTGIRETSEGLIGTISNDVVDEKRHNRPYAIYVAGTATEESPQAGSWVGPWNQLKDAIRGLPGQPSFRDKIGKTIKRLIENG